MPDFEITAPGGQKYRVTAPEGASEQDALAHLQQQLASVQTTKPDTSEADAKNFRSGINAYGGSDAIAHGMTMGLDRPIYAAGQTIGPLINKVLGRSGEGVGEAYTRGEREYDAAKAAYEKSNPILAPTLEIGGGVATLGNAAGGATSFLGRLKQGAKLGGIYGGVSSLSDSKGGVDERLIQGGKGALTGAAVGTAVPAAIDAAKIVSAPVRAMVSAARNPEQASIFQVARGITDDKLTPASIESALTSARNVGVQNATIADVAGPNAQRLASVYAKSPGPGRADVADFLQTRMEARPESIMRAVQPGLGTPKNAYEEIDRLVAKRAADAKPLYERAHNTPINTASPEYDAIMIELQTPSGQRALAAAKTKMLDEKIPSKQIYLNVADDGTVTMTRPPDTRTLDYVKRALDDKIQAARRGGNMDDARIFGGIKDNIVNNLDKLNPTFKKARAAYAGPSESRDAIDAGMSFLRMPPEEIAKTIATMRPGDLEFFRIGAARALRDIAGSQTDRTAFLLSPNIKERLAQIYPTRASYDRAVMALGHLKGQADLGRKIIGGSPTYENFAAAGDAQVDPMVLLDAAHSVASGNALGVASALRGISNKFGGITPKVSERGLKMLMSPDPVEQQRALDAMRLAISQQQIRPGNRAALGRGFTGGLLNLPMLKPQQK